MKNKKEIDLFLRTRQSLFYEH